MLGVESQGQAFQPEKPKFPPSEIKQRDFVGGEPNEKEKAKGLAEHFQHQDFELISNGKIVATFYRGFPTKIIPKEAGCLEIVEKKATGEKTHFFEKIDTIKFGEESSFYH